ncbi:MAG: sigma-70 family RNA polymerase sigma factor [bacterium]|nr:sigma-70 family RNA polymerase sigma factor [bacterium]
MVAPDGVEIDWADFFGRYRPLAVRVARGLVGTPERAEELVQEAARSLFERVQSQNVRFDSVAHARNSFLRTTKNLAVSHARRAGRRPAVHSFEDAGEPIVPTPEPPANELGPRLADALAALSPPEREALRQRYLEGLSYKEIAARTATPISTLHARVEAALRKIRGRIGKDAPPA